MKSQWKSDELHQEQLVQCCEITQNACENDWIQKYLTCSIWYRMTAKWKPKIGTWKKIGALTIFSNMSSILRPSMKKKIRKSITQLSQLWFDYLLIEMQMLMNKLNETLSKWFVLFNLVAAACNDRCQILGARWEIRTNAHVEDHAFNWYRDKKF